MMTVAYGAVTMVIVEVTLYIMVYVTSKIRTVRIIYLDMEEDLHSY